VTPQRPAAARCDWATALPTRATTSRRAMPRGAAHTHLAARH